MNLEVNSSIFYKSIPVSRVRKYRQGLRKQWSALMRGWREQCT
jgi:hypothetical protein